jgi:Ca2+-binding EF-hand superfamily protein
LRAYVLEEEAIKPRNLRWRHELDLSLPTPYESANEKSFEYADDVLPPPIPRQYVTVSEWGSLRQLTSLNESELEVLYDIFAEHQHGGLLNQDSFWRIVGSTAPILVHDIGSLLNLRMFSIFDVLKLGALTCLEFVLAMSVLAGQSRFLDRATFSFDVLDISQDQCLDLTKVQMVFAALDSAQQTVLFQVQHSHGHYNVTASVLAQAYAKTFLKYDTDKDGVLTKDEYMHMLSVSSAAPILLHPFSIDLPLLIAPRLRALQQQRDRELSPSFGRGWNSQTAMILFYFLFHTQKLLLSGFHLRFLS